MSLGRLRPLIQQDKLVRLSPCRGLLRVLGVLHEPLIAVRYAALVDPGRPAYASKMLESRAAKSDGTERRDNLTDQESGCAKA